MTHLNGILTKVPASQVRTSEELEALVARVKAAQQKFATFSQRQVDHIFRNAALAAANARIPLAKLAVEET
jgi:acetaldehyde dehydrogenase/alcohol dehydrogenase